jgi:hypothetical protein
VSGKGKRPSRRRKGVIRTQATAPTWEVLWHRKALEEKNAIADVNERVAIQHVIEKLRVDGVGLTAPHQSAVMGEEGSGLRELRPRRGRSRWRPLYRQVGKKQFAILAVAPESEVDSAGYDRGVRVAKRRLGQLEKSKKSKRK